jgi:alpha-tubulin suppressor-like RCC1 family protein
VKTFRSTLLCAGFLALLNLTQAQETLDSSPTAAVPSILIPTMNPDGPLPGIVGAFNGITLNNASLNLTSVADVATMLEAVQSEPPVLFDSLPKSQVITGWWSLKNPYWPPLPGNIFGTALWPLGNGNAILDDSEIDYEALQAAAAQTASASPMVRMSMMASGLASSYAYENPVYLTNLTASIAGDGSMISSFGIVGGTNFVPYDILMSTNLAIPAASWNWIGIGYSSNQYTFYEQPAQLAFYILAKPSKSMTVGIGDDSVGQCDVPFGLTNALQVAAGHGQSLALKTDGTVVAWGANLYGQGAVPTNLSSVAMISAGYYHDVALLTNGTVTAWGLENPSQGYYLTNVPANLANATVISAGFWHTLALSSNGTVVAWGYDDGLGETNVPAGLTNVTAIAAGFQFNLVVSNGVPFAWGDNSFGQCDVPAGLSNVLDVAVGPYHSLALLQNGTVTAWGDDFFGESDVPVGLSNVVAIAANGDVEANTAYSMALENNGSVVVWGNGAPLPFGAIPHTIGLAAGSDHALAVRTGPPTPVITLEPTNQYQFPGGTVTFAARGSGLYGVTYQWQTNGVNIWGATNATLTLENIQTAQFGVYDVVVTDNAGMGSIVSSNANLYVLTPPVITSETYNSQSFQTNVVGLYVLYNTDEFLQVTASAPGEFDGYPLSYQWQLDGTNIAWANSPDYFITALNPATYSLIISNAAGSVTAVFQVNVFYPGGVVGWGSVPNGQSNAAPQLTNIISLAAGKAHGVVALDNGTVLNWGSYWTGTSFVSVTAPPPFTNATAVAAGSRHDLALKTGGTVAAWGLNDFGQTNVPVNATNVIAVAAGGQESLALLKNGTVVQWGQTNAPIPARLTNVTAIAAGTNFSLALLQNSTVVAWGANNYGQTNIPAGLSNVVAIAAGGAHVLALKQNGTVVAWGAWTNVPAGLTNAMNVAAGENHSLALKNDGTLIAWGDNTFGQTNVVAGLNQMKLIAGGGTFSLAAMFSPTVMYPVNASQDLLLIYNTNSIGSATVESYYLQHRPIVGSANVLAISCPTNEIVGSVTFSNQVLTPYLGWLNQNPTKHPQYLVVFMDIPSRVEDGGTIYPSVQYQLSTEAPGIQTFVSSINMNGVNGSNDCIAYINKLAFIGTNYSPGKTIISASAGGYGNTNYYFDDTECCYGDNLIGWPAAQAVIQAGVFSNSVVYTNVYPDSDSGPLTNHITSGVNLAGYLSWGQHSSLGPYYATNGYVSWTGKSGWWIIATVESFNGQVIQQATQGNFIQWFSSNAFGGTNYCNTPVGAVSNVEEPDEPGPSYGAIYFGLWASGKNSAICAWNARNTPYFQVVGDPLVTK